VDAIAAIADRIAGIRQTLAAMAPQSTVAPTTVRTGTSARSGTGSSASFAAVLADEIADGTDTAAGAPQLDDQVATTTGLPATFAPALAAPAAIPVQHVGAYGPAQLANAAAIVAAGKAMGLSTRDQTIGVMTAMGESSLTVVNHGDTAGPDSRGLFQQRDNGAWGSLTDRMDPTISATNFFDGLAGIAGRDGMSPTAVAHQVQRNADPDHYTKYWNTAVAIVKAVG